MPAVDRLSRGARSAPFTVETNVTFVIVVTTDCDQCPPRHSTTFLIIVPIRDAHKEDKCKRR